MDYETGKGLLRMLFAELLEELPPEALDRIARKISAKIRVHEICHESHVRRQLDIEDLEMQADLANRRGDLGHALRLQNQAEDLRFQL